MNGIMQDNPLRLWLNNLVGRKTGRPVLVKALGERDRRRVQRHFQALERRDRLLRFGSVLTDEQVAAYVATIDFSRDIVFGVFNRLFQLVGVGHLALLPSNASAEFGVSVAATARGKGVGSRLFERAAMHCRNSGVDTLYMQCLSSNGTMMHIARKAGMEIRRDCGEADAHLHLPPPSPSSVLAEALEEQVAKIDYTVKVNVRAVLRWVLPRR
jgi:GNAT superfamily N-acetyltransferase